MLITFPATMPYFDHLQNTLLQAATPEEEVQGQDLQNTRGGGGGGDGDGGEGRANPVQQRNASTRRLLRRRFTSKVMESLGARTAPVLPSPSTPSPGGTPGSVARGQVCRERGAPSRGTSAVPTSAQPGLPACGSCTATTSLLILTGAPSSVHRVERHLSAVTAIRGT